MSDAEWSLAKARQDSVESVLRTEEVRTRRPRTSFSHGAYRVDCYRGNLIDELQDHESPTRRTLYIAVRLGGALISVGQLLEWRIPFAANPYDFWWAADAISKEESDVAYMVGSYWSFDDWPGDFGSIVLFNRLGIRSSLDRERVALGLVRSMLELEFGRRASILLLKAFPLEYESQPDEVDRSEGLRRRQLAMMRWYAQRLGVSPFVDQGTFQGWMWRPLRYCPPPTSTLPDESWLTDK